MTEAVARKVGRPPATALVSREHILSEAARLFRERGYQATTVRDIASAVGILSGSLFHHFASKEQMLVEMVREAAISMCAGAEVLVAPIDSPVDKLRALVRWQLECFTHSRMSDYYAVGVSEWRDIPASVQPEMKKLRQRYVELVHAVLEACADQGRLRVGPEATARVMHSVTTGTVSLFHQTSRYGTEQLAETLMTLLLNDEP